MVDSVRAFKRALGLGRPRSELTQT